MLSRGKASERLLYKERANQRETRRDKAKHYEFEAVEQDSL